MSKFRTILIANRGEIACRIGPAPVRDSYLDPDRLLAAAKAAGADALHPGYGFLSENGDFARASGEAGLVFIGPSPEAIDAMGNKAAAKRAMIAAGVPCIPGFQDSSDEGQTDARLIAEAVKLGFPLLIKAAVAACGWSAARSSCPPRSPPPAPSRPPPSAAAS